MFIHIPDQQPSNSLITSLSITVKSTHKSLQLGVDESYQLDIKQCDLSISTWVNFVIHNHVTYFVYNLTKNLIQNPSIFSQ